VVVWSVVCSLGFRRWSWRRWARQLQCLRLWRVWLAGGEGRVKKVGCGVVLGCGFCAAVGVFMAYTYKFSIIMI
jgi:hypothetical protein